MTRIRRFGVVKTATVAAVFYALAGLIFFGITAVFVLIGATAAIDIPSNGFPGGMFGATAGAMSVLLVGVIFAGLYGVFGWIFTAIACLLYNWVAGFTGGIEFQLEIVPPPAALPAPTWTPPAAPLPAAAPPAAPTEPPAAPEPPAQA